MSLSVYKTFSAGEVLTAADLNASFTNFTTNALSLISPLTGNLAAGSNKITGLANGTAAGDSLAFGQAAFGKVTLTQPATGSTITVADGKTLTASNTLTLAGADGSTFTIPVAAFKSASTGRSSTTTLADDPHLLIALTVGTWSVECWVPIWATSGGTQGYKCTFAFSGTQTNFSASHHGGGGTAFLTSVLTPPTAATNTSITTLSATPDWVRSHGTITVTVAGNLSLQWAQNSSDASATNVGIGGWLRAIRVG